MATLRLLNLWAFACWVKRVEKRGEVTVEVTSLAVADVFNEIVITTKKAVSTGPYGLFQVSPKGCRLAADATPEKYDLVVIDNCLGVGCKYAEMIPEAMRSRTLVSYCDFELQSGRYNPLPYVELGFSQLCSSDELVDRVLKVVVALREGPSQPAPRRT